MSPMIARLRAEQAAEDLPRRIQSAYDRKDIVLGQQLNIEAGVARGGSLVSGGAMRETVR